MYKVEKHTTKITNIVITTLMDPSPPSLVGLSVNWKSHLHPYVLISLLYQHNVPSLQSALFTPLSPPPTYLCIVCTF